MGYRQWRLTHPDLVPDFRALSCFSTVTPAAKLRSNSRAMYSILDLETPLGRNEQVYSRDNDACHTDKFG